MNRFALQGAKACFAACALLVSSLALAQDTSAITGKVLDSATKKAVADVVVTASSPSLAAEQMAVTGKDGAYSIPNLPVGDYALRFESSKHQPFSRSGVSVRAGTTVKYDVELIPEEGLSEELVVTGSRIPRPEIDKAAPVTVLSRAKIETSGKASIGDILQTLPEQGNAMNTQMNNGGDGSTRVNLRGLGENRTLVLLNGRRHVAGGTGADATVDLNTIPTQAIERIEVLKDGASAVYGSDAISGVVNVITRKDYAGTELNAFTGISQHGDGEFVDLSVTMGQASARGNILFSAGFYKQNPTWAGDRDFSKFDRWYYWDSRMVETSGSSAVPWTYIVPTMNPDGTDAEAGGNQAWEDLKSNYDLLDAYAITRGPENGAWRPFNFGGVEGAGGDYYNYQPANYLVTPMQRANVFATGGINLGESARAFFEASYTNRQSAQKLAPEALWLDDAGLTVSKDNIYNPFARDFEYVRRRMEEFGNRD
ncbi:MAG: TonB-dependent receptor, partial [Myxococcaceae bacterium]|nr:TonB-dependent receptor [Myxococcaceae bacterium]